MSWNLLSLKAFSPQGVGKKSTGTRSSVPHFDRNYFTIMAEWAGELLCKRNQLPFPQTCGLTLEHHFNDFTVSISRSHCLLLFLLAHMLSTSFWSWTLACETFWVLPMLVSTPVPTKFYWVPLFPICETVWNNIIQILLFPKSERRI